MTGPLKEMLDGTPSVSKWNNVGKAGIHGKKAAAVFPEPEIKDMDIEKQLNSIEGLSDESDCMWLSSDSRSSSFLSSNDSQDVWELDCWDLFLHNRFSILSLSGSRDFGTFDGSTFNPIKDVPVVLEKTINSDHEGSSQEEGATSLQNSAWNELKGSPVRCSESSDSPYERSLCEELLVSESSCASLSTLEDQPSHVVGFDTTDIWVSSLDLEGEDTKWLGDEGQDFDVFGSDFPSPSFSAGRNFQIRPPDSRSATSGQAVEVSSQLEDSQFDEPIFWPFDYDSYWHPDLDKFLCISPRKDGRNDEALRVDGSKSLRLRLHQKRLSPLDRKNIQGACRKKLIFDSTPTSAASEGKGRSLGNGVPRIGPVPSRLSTSTRASSEENPSKISMNKKPRKLKANRQKRCGVQGLLVKPLPRLEDCEIPELVTEGVPIEKLVGLNEFDGHEGISKEFNEDHFFLVESPCKNAKAISARETEWSLNNNNHDSFNLAMKGSCQSDQVKDACSEAYDKSQEDS